MADENKTQAQPITSASARGAAGLETSSAKPEGRDDEKVSVKALGRFPQDGDPHGKMAEVGSTFETTRSRAAELRANGLIEYGSESDEKDIHGHDTERHRERIKQRGEQGKIDDRNKSTPLKNPTLPGQD